jgi:hypothetical protein
MRWDQRKTLCAGVNCGHPGATLIESHWPIADHNVTLALGAERQ